jgi:4a-hydroxytetrahydrobiopterin dehydratase
MTNSDLPDRGGVTDRIGAAGFYESAGVEDWRVLWGGGYACAYFRAGSFGAGAGLVQAIGELAAAANHYPDVDLRPEGVTIRLFTPDVQGLTRRDSGCWMPRLDGGAKPPQR